MGGLKWSSAIVSASAKVFVASSYLKRRSFSANFAALAPPVRLKVAWKPSVVDHNLDNCFEHGVWDAKATPEVGFGVGTPIIRAATTNLK